MGICAVVLVLSTTEVRGEVPTISAHFSRDSVEVGDRVEYILDIETDRATPIGVPDFRKARNAKERKVLEDRKRTMSAPSQTLYPCSDGDRSIAHGSCAVVLRQKS